MVRESYREMFYDWEGWEKLKPKRKKYHKHYQSQKHWIGGAVFSPTVVTSKCWIASTPLVNQDKCFVLTQVAPQFPVGANTFICCTFISSGDILPI